MLEVSVLAILCLFVLSGCSSVKFNGATTVVENIDHPTIGTV